MVTATSHHKKAQQWLRSPHLPSASSIPSLSNFIKPPSMLHFREERRGVHLGRYVTPCAFLILFPSKVNNLNLGAHRYAYFKASIPSSIDVPYSEPFRPDAHRPLPGYSSAAMTWRWARGQGEGLGRRSRQRVPLSSKS